MNMVVLQWLITFSDSCDMCSWWHFNERHSHAFKWRECLMRNSCKPAGDAQFCHSSSSHLGPKPSAHHHRSSVTARHPDVRRIRLSKLHVPVKQDNRGENQEEHFIHLQRCTELLRRTATKPVLIVLLMSFRFTLKVETFPASGILSDSFHFQSSLLW